MSVRIAGWHDFFLATAGVGGGLTGLLIVAMSVNIRTILAAPSMVSRAATMIAALMVVVIVSCCGLLPEQSPTVFAVEVLLAGAAALGLGTRSGSLIMTSRRGESAARAAGKAALGIVPTALMVLGAVLLLAGPTFGAWLLPAGILLTFVASTANAWVLLVEVLR